MYRVRFLAMQFPFCRPCGERRGEAIQRKRAGLLAAAFGALAMPVDVGARAGDMTEDVLQFGRAILHDEARALDALADSLGDAFEQAIGLIIACHGKLIVSGLGKSGHVGRKIAATFASTGTTATFLHLAEAIHGDLGMAAKGDVAILISQSGETAELEAVIDHFEHVGIPIIAITGNSALDAGRGRDGRAGPAALGRSRAGMRSLRRPRRP